jgi:hypothetical protein
LKGSQLGEPTMTTVQAGSATRRPSIAARRFGYLAAIAVDVVVLWVVHQLLGWGWPAFLTEDFEEVLPLISASLIASMVVNAGFLVRDRGRFRALGDLINAAFGMAVSLRMWAVFPFDFSGYDTDWGWALRVALGVGIVATSIGALVNLVKLITGDLEFDRSR